MTLIFVYNANSGKLNTLFDIAHKVIKPETYQCSLCTLTHGNFSEKQIWKKFREDSGIDMQFFHKDEFEKKYDCEFEYPVVLKDTQPLTIQFDAKSLNDLPDLESLIARLSLLAG